MRNSHIIPTVFSHDRQGFEKRFKRLIKVSKKIQIDFMDGKFVAARSVPVKGIPNLKRYKIEFEAHLMVKNPFDWIEECKKKGFKRVIFHIEACKEDTVVDKILKVSKRLGLQVYIAIDPATPLKRLYPFIKGKKRCDGILLLGVRPGKEGQKMSKKIAGRIREIKRLNKSMIVQVDGGVNDRDISTLAKAGVDHVNSGSFVADAKDPGKRMAELEKLFERAKRRIRE